MVILFPTHKSISANENTFYRIAEIPASEPIMRPEYPWEGIRNYLYGSVIKTDTQYEMYYQTRGLTICRATSPDGLEWQKPLTNVADFSKKSQGVLQANNLAPLMQAPALGEGQAMTNIVSQLHMPSIMYTPDAEHPYQLFAFGESGYLRQYSDNGYHFHPLEGEKVIDMLTFENPKTQKNWVSDVSPCFRDHTGYTAMVKTYDIDAEGRTRRCVGRSTSEDFKNWTKPETVWVPGETEDNIAHCRGLNWADFYGLCPFHYGDGYLGFLWLFEIEHELPNGTHLGKMEVFLASSSDGIKWERLSDRPFIPWDLNFGSAGGMVTTPSAPIFETDEIKLYYSDCNFEHGQGEKDFKKKLVDPQWVIRCAQLPKERLVGISAKEGHCLLSIRGKNTDRLRINADCLEGAFTIEYCVNGQSLAHEVIENRDSTDLWTTPKIADFDAIKLSLNNATVYAVELAQGAEQ